MSKVIQKKILKSNFVDKDTAELCISYKKTSAKNLSFQTKSVGKNSKFGPKKVYLFHFLLLTFYLLSRCRR